MNIQQVTSSGIVLLVLLGSTHAFHAVQRKDQQVTGLNKDNALTNIKVDSNADIVQMKHQANRRRLTEIVFGGKKHKSADSGDEISHWRPEYAKTFKRHGDGGEWEECAGKDECFYGKGASNSNDRMQLEAKADNEFDAYAFEAWARCTDAATTKWKMHIYDIENGIMRIFVNGKLIREVEESEVEHLSDDGILLPSTATDNNIRVEIHRVDHEEDTSAGVWLGGFPIADYTDSCMVRKFCLKKLGDGSVKASKLRNINSFQLQCLSKSNELPSDLEDECEQWRNCMQAEDDALLTDVLRAGGAAPSLLELHTPATNVECVDPSIMDVESIDCECLDDIKNHCGSAPDKQECYRTYMCQHGKVSCSWKELHGCSTVEPCCNPESSLLQHSNALSANGSDNLQDLEDASLDRSLEGKCS